MTRALTLGLALWLSAPAAAQEVPDADAGVAIAEDGGAPAVAVPAESSPPQPPPRRRVYGTTVVDDRSDPAVVGASGTTVTREQVEALPGGDTQPLTAFVSMQPGVVQDSFGSNLHFRGNDGAVLYVIDGISLVSPSVGTVGQLLNTIPMRLVDSVQVLSGGFPVDYSYSLGGVVDIRTRRPTAEPTAELQLLYGSNNHVDVAANYSQQIGKLGVVASVNYLMTDRGLDTPNAVGVLNDQRVGGSAFLKARYDLTDHDRIEVLGTFQLDRFHIPIDPTMLPLSAAPPGAVRGNDVYGDGPPPFVPYDAQPTDTERTLFVALSYLHTGKKLDGQLSIYAREIYESFDCDAGRALGVTADPGSTCSNFDRDAFHVGLAGNLTWGGWAHQTWKAGIQLDEAPSALNFSLFTREDSAAQAGPSPSQTIVGGDRINSLTGGVFLEDRIELGKLTLLPGVRIDLQNTTFGPANLPGRFLAGPSVRLGASYAVNRVVILHAFAGYFWEAPTNYDAPVVAPLVIPSLAGQQLAVDVKGATTWSGEVGVSFHPTRRLTLGIDVWGRIMQDWLDHENIGNTALWAAFNWDQGWAAGGDVFGSGEIVRFWHGRFILDGFANLSVQTALQKGIGSLKFLFSPDDLQASQTWTVMDHVQFWTANVGLMLHDAERLNNLSVTLNYGSGYHVGVATNELVPEHTVVNVTLSHTFELPLHPTVAADVLNLFNDIYAYRLGTAYFGNSQYAPLRQFDLRLLFHFG